MRFVLQVIFLAIFVAYVVSIPRLKRKAQDECGISDYEFGERILGGKDVPPKKWPWLVAIEKRGQEHCTGSIISRRFILTAAHCARPISVLRVLVGSVDRRIAKHFRLNAFHSHPDFNKSAATNDIAIVELETEIDFDSNARPICLGKDFVEHDGAPAVIAGWGQTSAFSAAEILQEGTAEFVEFEPCRKNYLVPLPGEPDVTTPIKEQHICAVGTNKSDIWDGDSGGPLFSKSEKDIDSKGRWVQHGVCSYSTYHHHEGIPAVFTRVTTFCDWIKKTTKDEAECVDY